MKSTHLPEVSHGIETVTGTLIIDTELRDLEGFTCALAQDSVAAEAGVTWEEVAQGAGETAKVTLKVWAADGITAGLAAAKVSWIAVGK